MTREDGLSYFFCAQNPWANILESQYRISFRSDDFFFFPQSNRNTKIKVFQDHLLFKDIEPSFTGFHNCLLSLLNPRPGTRGPPRPGRPRSSARGEGGCECGLSGGCHRTQRRGRGGVGRGPAHPAIPRPLYSSPAHLPLPFIQVLASPKTKPLGFELTCLGCIAPKSVPSRSYFSLTHSPLAPSIPDSLSSRVLS